MGCGVAILRLALKDDKQVSRDAYLGGREEGGVGVSLVKGLPTGDDMATDDRLDIVVGNLRLTKEQKTI